MNNTTNFFDHSGFNRAHWTRCYGQTSLSLDIASHSKPIFAERVDLFSTALNPVFWQQLFQELPKQCFSVERTPFMYDYSDHNP